MKKTVIAVMILSVAFLLISCGQTLTSEQLRLQALRAQYDEIGQRHNDKLNEMLMNCAAVGGECLDYRTCCQCIDACVDNPSSGGEGINGGLAAFVRQSGILSKPATNGEIMEMLSDSLDVISRYRDIFDSIAVILDKPGEVDQKIEDLEEIYIMADNRIEDVADRESVMNGISTIAHSFDYWNENMDAWQQTLTGGYAKSSLGIIAVVGVIDGVGAVMGTLEGFRDTEKGEEGRAWKIAGRAVGEAAKTSSYTVIGLILL